MKLCINYRCLACGLIDSYFFVELLRAEGAPAEHPLLRNFGNPSSRVNLVMTSPCERCPSVRLSVGTDFGEGDGSLRVTRTGEHKNAFFLGGMKTHFYIVMSTNDSGIDNVTV